MYEIVKIRETPDRIRAEMFCSCGFLDRKLHYGGHGDIKITLAGLLHDSLLINRDYTY